MPWLFFLFVMGSGFSFFGWGCVSSQMSSEPNNSTNINVVFLTIDTLRVDALSCYNQDSMSSTPNIDALAQDGVVYEQAYSPISVTGPAFTTLMTGLEPSSHGIVQNFYLTKQSLKGDYDTIADKLRAQKYSTAAFISAFTLRSEIGLSQGFDTYDDKIGLHLRRPGKITTKRSLKWLSEQEESIFMWYHTFDAHGSLYSWVPDSEKPIQTPSPIPTEKQAYFAPYQIIGTESDPVFYKKLYAKAVEEIDRQIGMIVDELKVKNKYDNTLIVVVADHGETFTERIPWFDHGAHASEEQLHIPLIIKYPSSFQKFGRDSRLVGLMDVFPTTLDVLGVEIGTVDGYSLLEKDVLRTQIVGESSHCIKQVFPECSPLGPLGKSFAIRNEEYSVVLQSRKEHNAFLYFDRKVDVNEINPLKDAHKFSIETALLSLQEERSILSTRQQKELEQSSPQMLNALKKLGYVSEEHH